MSGTSQPSAESDGTAGALRVTVFRRAPQPQFHSLETMMATVARAFPPRVEVTWRDLPEAGADPAAVWRNLRFVARHAGPVNHVAGHVHYAAIPPGRTAVLTVADVRSAFVGRPFRDRLVRWMWFVWPARRAGRITTISEFTREEFLGLAPFARDRVRVIPVPCDPRHRFDPRPFREECPRVLCVGVKPNKNLERTAGALRGIRAVLAVVGDPTPAQRDALARCAIEHEIVTRPTDEAMRDQYRRCDLLCYASTYEGFGMPIVEAQATGRPVVTSRAAAMPEVAGGAACLVDPLDPGSIRDGVLRVLRDRAFRERLVGEGLRNAARFAPETVARAYVKVYEEVGL